MIAVASCAGHANSNENAPKSSSEPVLHSALISLIEEYQVFKKSNEQDLSFKTKEPGIRIINGRLVVDTISSGDVDLLRRELAALGATNISIVGVNVSCQLPVRTVERLESLDNLKYAGPAFLTTR